MGNDGTYPRVGRRTPLWSQHFNVQLTQCTRVCKPRRANALSKLGAHWIRDFHQSQYDWSDSMLIYQGKCMWLYECRCAETWCRVLDIRNYLYSLAQAVSLEVVLYFRLKDSAMVLQSPSFLRVFIIRYKNFDKIHVRTCLLVKLKLLRSKLQ